MDLANYDESTTLKHGQEVRIRAIRPADKGLVMEMFRNLEPKPSGQGKRRRLRKCCV